MTCRWCTLLHRSWKRPEVQEKGEEGGVTALVQLGSRGARVTKCFISTQLLHYFGGFSWNIDQLSIVPNSKLVEMDVYGADHEIHPDC